MALGVLKSKALGVLIMPLGSLSGPWGPYRALGVLLRFLGPYEGFGVLRGLGVLTRHLGSFTRPLGSP